MSKVFIWKPDEAMKYATGENEEEAWEHIHTRMKFFSHLSTEQLKDHILIEEDLDPAWHKPLDESARDDLDRKLSEYARARSVIP